MKSAGMISASKPMKTVKQAPHEGLASEVLCLEAEKADGTEGKSKGSSSTERKEISGQRAQREASVK